MCSVIGGSLRHHSALSRFPKYFVNIYTCLSLLNAKNEGDFISAYMLFISLINNSAFYSYSFINLDDLYFFASSNF